MLRKWQDFRYSLYAPFYNIIKPTFDEQRRISIENLNIESGSRVLILGGGTGLDLDFLAKDIKISISDYSPAMLKKIKARASKLNMDVEIKRLNAEYTGLDSESYDYVILHLILAVVPNSDLCLKEAERLVKAGGKIAIMDKFLQDGQEASIFRKFINMISILFFTNINRRFDELLSKTSLRKVSDEEALLNGFFRRIILEKPNK